MVIWSRKFFTCILNDWTWKWDSGIISTVPEECLNANAGLNESRFSWSLQRLYLETIEASCPLDEEDRYALSNPFLYHMPCRRWNDNLRNSKRRPWSETPMIALKFRAAILWYCPRPCLEFLMSRGVCGLGFWTRFFMRKNTMCRSKFSLYFHLKCRKAWPIIYFYILN